MSIAIILAAGKGTRMRSHLPKPIVPFMGKPIVAHLIENFKKAGIEDIYLIVGHGADEVKKEIGNGVNYIYQKKQKGTAHAVKQLKEINVWKNKNVFVFVGDSPLISSETIKQLLAHHENTHASCTFLTALFPIDLPYARVIKNEYQEVVGCVEEKNATVEQLQIRELLSSHFIFKGNDLFQYLNEIKPDIGNQEYYLTDIIKLFLNNGLKVETLPINNYRELVGLNTPEDLKWAEKNYRTPTQLNSLEELILCNKKYFLAHFIEIPSFVAYAPGRINVLGEHTDYNQGLAMPCAINRWVTVSMVGRKDKIIHIISLDFDEEMIFELGGKYFPKSLWQKYIYGCIQLFNDAKSIPSGFNVVISGNVPIGSGVSSSAALEVAFMNALNHFSKTKINELELIKLCQQVEHCFLNVKSGLLDQYASQFSKAEKIMILDCQKLTHKYISAEMNDYVWVLCDSKVKRTLAGSKYSERVEETKNALDFLKQKIDTINKFRDIQEIHISLLEDVNQQKRIRHYINENERVKEAVEVLQNKNVEEFGKLITQSHYSLKDEYEVSCAELDFLVEEALKTNYCIGSRMMGGGFGGCTINLVKNEYVDEFKKIIQKKYYQCFKIEVEINTYQIVGGADVKVG